VSRAHKIANLAGIVLPFVGLVIAVALLWNTWLHPVDVVLLAALHHLRLRRPGRQLDVDVDHLR
jgi:hypothetical protein